MRAFVLLGLDIFHTKPRGNVSETTYSVLSGTKKHNTVNQSVDVSDCRN